MRLILVLTFWYRNAIINNKQKGHMKTFFNLIATTMVFIGLVMMAGSAGDCDGACMEQANTMSEMMMIVFIGLSLTITGAIIMVKDRN